MASFVLGTPGRPDGVERTAVLAGRRAEVGRGRRVGVVGVLRVIDHGAAVVNDVHVPPWSEVRVEQPVK